MSRGVRLAAWSAFLVLTLRLLHGPAFGHLSMPLGSLDELAAWANRTAPSAMALTVVRLAAIAAAWYLTAATALAVVADLAGWRRTATVIAALSPALVRRLASRSAGVGLAAGALLAVTPMPTRLAAAPADASTRQAADPPPHTATMTRLPGTPPTGATRPATPAQPEAAARPADASPPGNHAPSMTRLYGAPPTGTTRAGSPAPATMTRLPGVQVESAASPADATNPDTSAPPTMARLAADAAAPAPAPPTAAMARLPGAGRSGPAALWPVAQGDSFWSIAYEALTDHLGHRPTDDDVSRYWRHLIAANRNRLLDPANCDLLVPGQQLELPPPA